MTAADTVSSAEQQGEDERQTPVTRTGPEENQESNDTEKKETGRIIAINEVVAQQEAQRQEFVAAFMEKLHVREPLALGNYWGDEAKPHGPSLAERAKTDGVPYSRNDILLMLSALTIGNQAIGNAAHYKKQDEESLKKGGFLKQVKRAWTLFVFNSSKKEIAYKTYGYADLYERAREQAATQGEPYISEADCLNHALAWWQESDPTFERRADKLCIEGGMRETLQRAVKNGVRLNPQVGDVVPINDALKIGRKKIQIAQAENFHKFVSEDVARHWIHMDERRASLEREEATQYKSARLGMPKRNLES